MAPVTMDGCKIKAPIYEGGAIELKNSAARKLRQVPAGYLLVGVDPHKKKHAAFAMTQDLVGRGRLKFANSRQGFDEVVGWAKQLMVKADCRGVFFAIEVGGHYWRNLSYFLDENGVPFRLINIFTLKRRREGKEINKRKNDFRDAEVAAELLTSGEFTETRLPQGVYADLRATHNAYRRLVKDRTRIINLLKGLLDGLFPEFANVFKDPCCKTALMVLATCPVPTAIALETEQAFVDRLKATYPEQHPKACKLRALHFAARTSIGIRPGANSVSMEISLLVDKYRLIGRQVDELIERLTMLVDAAEESEYLLSVPGLNYVSVAGLLAELGSFRAYHNSKQLIKMAGTNPTESESGGKRSSRTPMSRKGRTVLRYCAWVAVVPLLRHNPDFSAWAKRLRDRPAHDNPLGGRQILGAGVNKLLRLAFSLVTKRTYYRSPQLAAVPA